MYNKGGNLKELVNFVPFQGVQPPKAGENIQVL